MGQVNYPKVADSSSFDEDSSDALSPEQPASHESQGSVPSPLEARVSEPPPSATSVSPAQVSFPLRSPGAQTCWSCPGEVPPWAQVGREAGRSCPASSGRGVVGSRPLGVTFGGLPAAPCPLVQNSCLS